MATEEAIRLVERARAGGLDVAFDMHTRLYGTTYLNTILPNWAVEEGRDALMRHLRSIDSRAKMKDYRSIVATGGWDRVVLLDNAAFPEFSRRNFGEIGRRRAATRMTSPSTSCGRDRHLQRPMVLIRAIRKTIRPPFRASGLHAGVGRDHARARRSAGKINVSRRLFLGTWFWRFMVRERKLLWPRRRYTASPGYLPERSGSRIAACARRCPRRHRVFDPEEFGERGTTFEPNQLAHGMHHVVVNGVATLSAGALTGARAGQVLRQGAEGKGGDCCGETRGEHDEAREIVSAAEALDGSLTKAARAQQQITFRLGHVDAQASHSGVGADASPRRSRASPRTQMKVNVFHAGQLGAIPEQVRNVLAGTQDMHLLFPEFLTNLLDESKVISAPYLFKSHAHQQAIFHSESSSRRSTS